MLYPLFICLLLAAKTTTTVTGDKAKAPPSKEAAAKPETARAPAPAAIPPAPPRIAITAPPGTPSFGIRIDARSAKVPTDKLDATRKALEAAKLDALSTLHGHLKPLYDAAMKASTDVDAAEREAARDKAKLDKVTEQVDAAKGQSTSRGKTTSVPTVSPSIKANADRAAAVAKKLTDASKAVGDEYATALEAYQKALTEAQPFIDTIRSETGLAAQ